MNYQSLLQKYLKEAVTFIRTKEMEMARGNLSKLQELDNITDETLLRKWSWISTIVGVIISFFVLPMLMQLLFFLPVIVHEFLLAITKVCMGLSLAMFGTAMYFTITSANS